MKSLTPLRALLGGVLVLALLGASWWVWSGQSQPNLDSSLPELPFGEGDTLLAPEILQQITFTSHPLAIEQQRQREYPGSELVIEQELGSQGNYQEYVASYQSDGLTIYGLLTVPTGDTPAGGWPIIIFNHGYIRPEDYQTTQRYEAYQAYFARNGYITFKSDYRGHGQSEGDPEGGYYSPAYTTDVLNAKASVQRLPEANPDEVGFWGHSMGGYITLRSMVIADDIDAGVIWGGVVGSYEEIYQAWQRRRSRWTPSPEETRARQQASSSSQTLVAQYGEPNLDAEFWRAIDPTAYLGDISGPIQLHHGQADASVDWTLSEALADRLEAQGTPQELYLYPGADHNLSGSSFSPAMQRSLEFFDRYVKNM